MHLLEHEGKTMLALYGVATPPGVVVTSSDTSIPPRISAVVKAQVRAGGRGRSGGIRFVQTPEAMMIAVQELIGWEHTGERCEAVLIEDRIDAVAEYYVSLSYDTVTRGPVLAFSARGGIDVGEATIVPVVIRAGITDAQIETALEQENVPHAYRAVVTDTIQRIWRCFLTERALLTEINPLFLTRDGRAIAGDAKVILDDDVVRPQERRFLSLGGDIAILASGGGASLLNIDALMAHGGRPANYTEYSGNPSADVVRDLTVRVLAQPNIRGCWAVGGTANFTDIYETMRGFLDGLRMVRPKPTYPIVVRRDGPRQAEAFAMLRNAAMTEGFQLHCFGSETPMEESARFMVKLAYGDLR